MLGVKSTLDPMEEGMKAYGVYLEVSGPKGQDYGEDGFVSRFYEEAREWFEDRIYGQMAHLRETYGAAEEVPDGHQVLSEAVDKVLSRLRGWWRKVDILDVRGAVVPDPEDEGAYFVAVLYAVEG